MGLYPYTAPLGQFGPPPGASSAAPFEGPAFCAKGTFPPTGRTSPGAFPVPVASALQGGVTGAAYSETITAQGGFTPYTFAVTAGALPTATSMSSAGLISGTPSATGTFNFTVTVTDSHGNTGSTAFQIIIAAPSSGAASNYGFVA